VGNPFRSDFQGPLGRHHPLGEETHLQLKKRVAGTSR